MPQKTFPDESRELLAKSWAKAPTGWSDVDAADVESLQRIAKRLLKVDQAALSTLLDVLAPFCPLGTTIVCGFRLAHLRWSGRQGPHVAQEHPTIREQLKREYRALLVDEFQDTDPVQYEIVLYLAERQGRHSASWREIDLEAGKLFIVGDPKQSIYAFRRADIEAFDYVGGPDGATGRCAANWRRTSQPCSGAGGGERRI